MIKLIFKFLAFGVGLALLLAGLLSLLAGNVGPGIAYSAIGYLLAKSTTI